MKNGLFILIALLLFTPGLLAQPFEESSEPGEVVIYEPVEVSGLIERHSEFLHDLKTYRGYRIELARSKDLDAVEQQKAGFVSVFKDLPAYVIWDQIYYRLKIGNFRSRVEAYQYLQKIRKVYPDAYIVIDQVEIF